MLVRIKLFAAAKQLAGADSIAVDVQNTPTIENLRRSLAEQFPRLAQLAEHALFAVNTEYADSQAVITARDEIACIPPVSGG